MGDRVLVAMSGGVDSSVAAALLHEQVAHQRVEGQVGGGVQHGIVGFIHGGAQAAHARKLVDAVHGFEHGTGLRLQNHICKRREHSILLWHLIAGLVKLFAPIGTGKQGVDVLANLLQVGFIFLVLLRFDDRLILLANIFRIFCGNGQRIGEFQCLQVFQRGVMEVGFLDEHLPEQQASAESVIVMFDGVL